MARLAGGPRRSGADRGSDTAVMDAPMEPRMPARRRWSGSGGRWWVWVGRLILWAFILVVIVNGIRAPFQRFNSSPTAAPTKSSDDAKSRYPSGAAAAYATEFTDAYLNFDQKNPSARDTALSYFLPDGQDTRLGWDGNGQLTVQSVQVAGVDVRDANNATVTMLVKANGTWLQLAVPVYSNGGRMVISGQPALLPAPQRATLPSTAPGDQDGTVADELQTTLTGFFTAYGTGDQSLSQFVDQGSSITGLPSGVLTFSKLGDVTVPKGAADQRVITAQVTWQLPAPDGRTAPAQLQESYQLTVVKRDSKWYVRDIRGATP
jgi:YD repeat-containing protein